MTMSAREWIRFVEGVKVEPDCDMPRDIKMLFQQKPEVAWQITTEFTIKKVVEAMREKAGIKS